MKSHEHLKMSEHHLVPQGLEKGEVMQQEMIRIS